MTFDWDDAVKRFGFDAPKPGGSDDFRAKREDMPKGTYTAILKSVDFNRTSRFHTGPQWGFTWMISGGPWHGVWVYSNIDLLAPPNGRFPSGTAKIAQLMVALGVQLTAEQASSLDRIQHEIIEALDQKRKVMGYWTGKSFIAQEPVEDHYERQNKDAEDQEDGEDQPRFDRFNDNIPF